MIEQISTGQNQSPGRKRRTRIIVAVVVVIAIVVIAMIALSMSQLGANSYKATVYIHVTSAHIANVVDINLYVNGNEIKSDSIGALSSQVYQYDAWLSGSSANLTISGTGHGGGLGDSSDSKVIEVSDGGTYNVYLIL